MSSSPGSSQLLSFTEHGSGPPLLLVHRGRARPGSEGYEKVLQNLLDLEVEAAKKTGVDWASTLATAHAKLVRETSEVFFQTLSAQLKS